MTGRLIAFEGLDQSGKQTQAEWLAEALRAAGHRVQTLSFPDYATTIGAEIGAALQGQRAYGPDVLQLLYIANRYEHAPAIRGWLAEGTMVVADRYAASSLAYGEAQGLDAGWLTDAQRLLPAADLTLVLDIAPETSLAAQACRPRPVRARPAAAVARARQLPAPGRPRRPGTSSTARSRPSTVRLEVTAAVRSRLALP